MKYDTVVLGGGTSGVAAAVASARQGAQTLLVERNEFLGGMLTSGLGLLGYRDRAGKPVIGGIAQELIDKLQETDDTLGHNFCPILNSLTPINTSMMQLRLMELCHNAGVHLLLCCEACAVTMDGSKIKSVAAFGKNHFYDLEAPVFIDATGDGDVCQLSGVPMVERGPGNEMQPGSLIFTLSGVEREPLLAYIAAHPDEAKTPEGYEMDTSPEFYRSVNGYNFLGLDGVINKAREAGDYNDIPRDRFSTITNALKDRMTINNTRVMHFDGSDLFALTKGLEEGYRQMSELLRFIPRYVPGYEHSQLSTVSPMMGVRESRRCVGQKTLCHDQIIAGSVPEDTVALCGYNIDIHHGADEGSELYIVEHGYGIPYGVMVSDRVENLLFTGRLISVDRDTYGSSRIMSTCMALGEAAGCAAAQCLSTGEQPNRLDVKRLRQTLLSENAILEVAK